MQTKDLGFNTKMVHAGHAHDAVRQRRDADLPDLDLRLRQRPDGRRPVCREGGRVHLHAHRQPDDPGAREERRGTREWRGGDRDGLRDGGGERRLHGPAVAGRPPGQHRVGLRPVARPHREAVQPLRRRVQLRGHVGHRERADVDAAEHEDGLPRVAVEPGDAGHRHPRGVRASPTATARSSSSTTRSPAPISRSRSTSAPTSSSTR